MRRPDAVLHVAAERAGTDRPQPLGMIEKCKVFFDLDVPEIMPVTDLRRIHFIEQRREFTLGWDFFISSPALDSQPDVLQSGTLNDAAQAIFHSQ